MMVKRILIIDDDTDDSELFEEAVRDLDSSITIEKAPDGLHAMALLGQTALPDIIFLDINMPKMDGWEFLTTLKSMEAFKNIPIIMYSTSSMKKEVIKAFDLGAEHFFIKPDSFTDLKATLKNIMEL